MSGRIIGRRRLGRGRGRSELDRVPALGQLLRALETVAAPSNYGWRERRPPAAPERAAKAAAAGRRRAATPLEQLRVEIANRLRRGDSLERVERELIAPSRLSEERQSALWLYAWSLPKLKPALHVRPVLALARHADKVTGPEAPAARQSITRHATLPLCPEAPWTPDRSAGAQRSAGIASPDAHSGKEAPCTQWS